VTSTSTSTSRRDWAQLVLGATLASAVVLALILFVGGDFGDKNDFPVELLPAYQALYAGHLKLFEQMSALAALLVGAGWRSTYFATALPCLAAVPLFGVWFAFRAAPVTATGDATAGTQAATVRRRQIMGLFALVAVVDPVLWYAGVLGHPEELVGTTLALAAVLVAADGRGVLALVLVALAVLNKPGLVEVVPVVFAVRRAWYSWVLLSAGLLIAGFYALYNTTSLFSGLHLPARFSAGAITAGGGFYPFQLLWHLGPQSWLVIHEHVLLPVLCVGLAALWLLRSAQSARQGKVVDLPREALWLTALLLLMRTALEPWDNTYYNIPLIICLLCLEAGSIPLMTIAASLGVLLLVPTNHILALSLSGQATLYAVVVLPVLAAMLWRVFAMPHRQVGPATPNRTGEVGAAVASLR
jgi:hypothetical protein